MSWFSKVFSGKKEVSPTEQEQQQQEKELSADEADEVLAEDNRSLIRQLIASNGLSMGVDLSKVVLPTFILEPRSLLEKLGDTVIHPEIFATLADSATPEERMLDIVRWYMSAYHVRPRGTKKPFNPVLGETFSATYAAADSASTSAASNVTWTAQQVSHHPPVSAFFARTADGAVAMQGSFAPKSKFLGNSAASMGGGGFRILLGAHGEVYYVTWPNVYVRGVLFGSLLMEIGGPVVIKCPKTDLTVELEFVTKGFFGGSYHKVTATCFRGKNKADKIFSVDGSWTTKTTVTRADGESEILFDTATSPVGSTTEIPMNDEVEAAKGETKRAWSSRVIWKDCTESILAQDQEGATTAKTAAEDYQRKLRTEREKNEEVFAPSLFTYAEAQSVWNYQGPDAVGFPDIEQLS
jgi:hypothetical protein